MAGSGEDCCAAAVATVCRDAADEQGAAQQQHLMLRSTHHRHFDLGWRVSGGCAAAALNAAQLFSGLCDTTFHAAQQLHSVSDAVLRSTDFPLQVLTRVQLLHIIAFRLFPSKSCRLKRLADEQLAGS